MITYQENVRNERAAYFDRFFELCSSYKSYKLTWEALEAEISKKLGHGRYSSYESFKSNKYKYLKGLKNKRNQRLPIK